MSVDISGDGGVMKEILAGGEGPMPSKNMTVFAHYTGRLADGSVFDSSIGKPHRVDGFHFKLDAGAVIRGWDVGFATMKKGEKAMLTCRHDYAYGDRGQFGGKTLIFEVELLDFKFMTEAEVAAQNAKVDRLRR